MLRCFGTHLLNGSALDWLSCHVSEVDKPWRVGDEESVNSTVGELLQDEGDGEDAGDVDDRGRTAFVHKIGSLALDRAFICCRECVLCARHAKVCSDDILYQTKIYAFVDSPAHTWLGGGQIWV